jgi:hypothetical protein
VELIEKESMTKLYDQGKVCLKILFLRTLRPITLASATVITRLHSKSLV